MATPSHRPQRRGSRPGAWLVAFFAAVLLVAVGAVGGAVVRGSAGGGFTGLQQAITEQLQANSTTEQSQSDSAQSQPGDDGSSQGDSSDQNGWGDDQFGGQFGGSQQWPGQSQDTLSEGQTTAATSKQSAGVVVVEAQLADQNAVAAGTGMVLTSTGLVLTNNHVVEDSDAIRVTIPSTGRTYVATVVGTNATDDVAVLKLANASGLSTVTLDDDHDLATGDTVTGVGNAGGTGSLVAASGTVTALDQQVTTQAEQGTPSESLTGLIETDAAIQSGDSGGPLLDDEGEVVGMDTAASATGRSVGYAIPISTAVTVAKQIVSAAGGSLTLAA
ncbi:trypsin-like peptidase [Branchiibius hedensis]|uniref:Trypsin-like peptidase domain-containing protein n=1 Tax=Branchiibius hedensis TaxID=672460 RepID=A0A2Y9C170_9MICO|nr:trypsin-like peptidase domain-containing protein [Branchiibius hedensis]PWJ25028.1 trypsin-like peptidase [Branchiibius hedensis]SSA33843.1 Trypsin-like peptidase domain-containing protein [Branchiibius hedensis]